MWGRFVSHLEPLQIPQELRCRFKVLGLLGQGGMGIVFRAHDRVLHREVAIKLLGGEPRAEVLTRMHREARLMASFRHPNVVEVFDHGLVEGRPYIVMEFLDGKDLGKIDEKGAFRHLLKIAEALDMLHAVQVFHRDIKPENIMLTRGGRPVLTDFGLAYDPQEATLTGTDCLVGTPSFLSPEQFAGELSSPGDDWWAWSVCAFFLMERRVPYSWEHLVAHSRGARAFPKLEFQVLSRESRHRELLVRSLSPEIKERPVSAAEIRSILSRPKSSAIFPANPQEKPLPFRRLLTIQRVGIVLFLFALLALLWMVQPERRPFHGRTRKIELPSYSLADDLKEKLIGELDHAAILYRTPSGEIQDLHGTSPPEGYREFLSPDPVCWGEVLDLLPELSKMHRWFLSGGHPEDLPVATRLALVPWADREEFSWSQWSSISSSSWSLRRSASRIKASR
jgi:serine/threonine protein kinase